MTILLRRIHSPVYRMRVKGILEQILPWLNTGDRILDVGCGFGVLGKMIMESPRCPARVRVTGLEKIRRDSVQIPVDYYFGDTIPYSDNSFDIIILADVLHHETDPQRLIDECVRVAERYLIIKDHKLDGFCSKLRISLMDWSSNIQYGIPCIYRYNGIEEWHSWYARHGLIPVFERPIKLYPKIINILLGGRIQYFAVLRTDRNKNGIESGFDKIK